MVLQGANSIVLLKLREMLIPVKPGQHMFVTMPSVGLWTSHPFSLAWSAENVEISDDPEKGMVVIEDIAGKTTTTVTTNTNVLGMSRTHVSAIIRARDGFTGKLLKKAAGSVNGRFVANAYVEGPYGGQHSLRSYGTVVLVAGGVSRRLCLNLLKLN